MTMSNIEIDVSAACNSAIDALQRFGNALYAGMDMAHGPDMTSYGFEFRKNEKEEQEIIDLGFQEFPEEIEGVQNG